MKEYTAEEARLETEKNIEKNYVVREINAAIEIGQFQAMVKSFLVNNAIKTYLLEKGFMIEYGNTHCTVSWVTPKKITSEK